MKKIWTKFVTDYLPEIFGWLWVLIFIFFSIAALLWSVKAVVSLLGGF